MGKMLNKHKETVINSKALAISLLVVIYLLIKVPAERFLFMHFIWRFLLSLSRPMTTNLCENRFLLLFSPNG